jgi:hypothetical protein
MSNLSDNFEIAFRRIEELEKENQSLKEQLTVEKREEFPVEELPQVNKPVDFHNSQRVSNMIEERDAAMKRYTVKLQRDIKTFKKDGNGKT